MPKERYSQPEEEEEKMNEVAVCEQESFSIGQLIIVFIRSNEMAHPLSFLISVCIYLSIWYHHCYLCKQTTFTSLFVAKSVYIVI
jgi:hypothetical protein